MAANRGVIPPIAKLRAAGAPIANGTDNNTNDLFEVMRIALLTERISRNDPFPGTRPQPEDMLEDATRGGSRAVRQEGTIGSLEVGKKADLLVVDTLRAHLVPAGRFVSAWIHNGQPADIESVMIDGQWVMRDRKVVTVDEASIIAEADKVGKRIWGATAAAACRYPEVKFAGLRVFSIRAFWAGSKDQAYPLQRACRPGNLAGRRAGDHNRHAARRKRTSVTDRMS